MAFKASPELEEHKKYHIQTNESTDDDDHQSSGVRLPNLPKAGTDVPTSHRGKKTRGTIAEITDIEQISGIGVFMYSGIDHHDKLVASGKLPTNGNTDPQARKCGSTRAMSKSIEPSNRGIGFIRRHNRKVNCLNRLSQQEQLCRLYFGCPPELSPDKYLRTTPQHRQDAVDTCSQIGLQHFATVRPRTSNQLNVTSLAIRQFKSDYRLIVEWVGVNRQQIELLWHDQVVQVGIDFDRLIFMPCTGSIDLHQAVIEHRACRWIGVQIFISDR